MSSNSRHSYLGAAMQCFDYTNCMDSGTLFLGLHAMKGSVASILLFGVECDTRSCHVTSVAVCDIYSLWHYSFVFCPSCWTHRCLYVRHNFRDLQPVACTYWLQFADYALWILEYISELRGLPMTWTSTDWGDRAILQCSFPSQTGMMFHWILTHHPPRTCSKASQIERSCDEHDWLSVVYLSKDESKPLNHCQANPGFIKVRLVS